MANQKFKLEIGGRDLEIEIRNLAEQASGSCLVRYGDTLILATCVISREGREMGFLPLTVDYEERYYAAGKILGSRYIRRESRPSDEAILTSRLIDRAIRPLFPEELSREIQVVITCLSWDRENDPDLLGLLGASQALSISEIPWSGPIGGLRIGRIEGKFILNPVYEQREESDLDLVLAGVKKNDQILINMIEAEAEEIPEEIILKAVQFAKPEIKKIIDFQEEILKKIGKEKIPIEAPPRDLELEKEIEEFLGDRLEKALYRNDKLDRMEEVNNLKEELAYFVEGKYPGMGKTKYAKNFFEKKIKKIVHENILKAGMRPDGRGLDELREIHCEVGLLPRTHGSGLFCRGQTKTLSILTLGAPEDVRLLEGMEIMGKKRFMHHYNFPPYSTGEVKPIKGPGRREIGHGMLVEKALLPLIPSFDEFPYTMRVVSEILSSNGSTSMASVSSASLALMDAGVKIKAPAAGIAIGLMQDQEGNYKTLVDIQGPEDHHGDMDFKIAGTRIGITAMQMDVKIEGITEEILKEALKEGKKSRLKILDLMEKVIKEPRSQLSPFAPRILTLQINPEKIREVIGPGGKVINEIIEETGVAIDIQPSGLIYITSEKEEAAKKAVAWIKNITREVKVGETFQGKVVRILNFGAMVEILPGIQGLIHISQLAPYRVKRVEDIVRIGEIIPVKVISIDEQGRINLSLKKTKFQLKKRF
ncbi:MAG: polyribonucleotide nucleotidyltransferase [Patescibacteria group bacterium]|nr:polyribonucleotide nucleotidyltransferase [Patescibacteria group bacterium]